MGIRKMVGRLTKPVEDADREELEAYCSVVDATPLDQLVLRSRGRYVGEIRSIRIVPRAGADALEVAFTDGRGSATAVFLGRRKIAGLTPGRRMLVEGVAGTDSGRTVIVNPIYTLLK
ncbi:MAG: ATP-dependent helicase RecG [Actinomycetia bacterium]|nr:ATP-dependent helicase RecG [Actinomycetes bacterium]